MKPLKYRIADMVEEQIVYKTDCTPDSEERFEPELEFETQRITRLETMIRVREQNGAPRYFRVRVSEVM